MEYLDSIIMVGWALCDANRADEAIGLYLPKDLLRYFNNYKEKQGLDYVFAELQPEKIWVTTKNRIDKRNDKVIEKNSIYFFIEKKDNKWLRIGENNKESYSELLAQHNLFGVHQPIREIDVITENKFKRLQSIASIKQAMKFTDMISAKYFVFHLVQQDYWHMKRSEQIRKSLEVFKAISEYYKENNFTFIPLVENLEFPKIPSTGSEIRDLYHRIKEFFPEIKLVIDIPHLWHTRKIILSHGNSYKHLEDFEALNALFSDYLNYTLSESLKNISRDIYLFHFGGCWDDETHTIPGLLPGENILEHSLHLRENAHYYDVNRGMDINKVLDSVLEFSLFNKKRLKMILEISNHLNEDVQEAILQIREDLKRRAEDKLKIYQNFIQFIKGSSIEK